MKLSLKKKAGGGEKKAKRKSSGGAGLANFKTFFAEHVEKLILGAIGIVSLLLVVKGFTQEKLETGPDAVEAAVNTAENRIDSSTWAEVKQDRSPEADTFEQRASLDVIPIDLASYQAEVPFHARLQERSKQRVDPALLPPFEIEVRSGYGGLSVKGKDDSLDATLGRSNQVGRSWSARSTGRGRVTLGGSYESRFFVSITGLVPYKKQFDGFLDAFRGTPDYSIERDVPRYLFVDVERAEVLPDGSLTEWQKLDTERAMEVEPMELWGGRADEIASAEHLVPGLVMPIPPIVMRDLTRWAVHSTVPLERPDGARRQEASAATEQSAISERERRRRSRDRGSQEESSEDDSYNESAEVAKPALSAENGMLRFFDLTVEPGKTYRYRVQTVLDDPNNPTEDGLRAPTPESCETDVLVRLKSAAEPYRRSPWSEPSDPVVVPQGSAVLASSASTPKTMAGGPRRVVPIRRRPYDEPSIDIMALVWDASGTRDVPVVLNVRRGSILNGTATDIEVIDPAAQRIMPLERYGYRTDAVVLDIHGGVPIDDLTSPGSVLIWKDGALEFHSEVSDQSLYSENVIPPDEDAIREAEERKRQEEASEGATEERGRGREGRGRGRGRGDGGGRRRSG